MGGTGCVPLERSWGCGRVVRLLMVRERLGYVDALRGVALVLMVVNHTARYWIGSEMGWTRYHLIYLTTSVAGPIFLFLVGFVLPLSFESSTRPGLKYARRALGTVAA